MQTPPFLTKLYQLVDDPNTTALIAWTDDKGLSFTVHKTDEFARDILPKYFKHSNFSSFVRQLNQYGFHKQNPDKWMFGHDSFRKDRPDLLKSITRRRPKQAPPATQTLVAPHALSQNRAVLELGHYGIDGELKALKRDKDLLIKELVVTRQAEEKLKTKCDSLESRMQGLEHTTKQMQAFIMHYFSQVLQPYSHAVASRKRKRLPSSSTPDINASLQHEAGMGDGVTDAMDVVTAEAGDTDSVEMSKMAQMAQAAAAATANGASTVDALRAMMQQMGMNVARHPPGAHHAHTQAKAIEGGSASEDRQRMAFDPATVQELPEVGGDEVLGNGVSANALVQASNRANGAMTVANGGVNINANTTVSVNGGGNVLMNRLLASGGSTVPDGSEIDADVSLDFLGDMAVSPQSSLSMDALESDFKLATERNHAGGTMLAVQVLQQGHGMGKDAGSTELHVHGLDQVNENGGSTSDDERAIEQLLELDDSALPPPLSHLPDGTDIHSLAQRIESFASHQQGESSV